MILYGMSSYYALNRYYYYAWYTFYNISSPIIIWKSRQPHLHSITKTKQLQMSPTRNSGENKNLSGLEISFRFLRAMKLLIRFAEH